MALSIKKCFQLILRVQYQGSTPREIEILSKLLRNDLLQEVCDKKPSKAGLKIRISYRKCGRNFVFYIEAKVQN